jgi:hypothetical protein
MFRVQHFKGEQLTQTKVQWKEKSLLFIAQGKCKVLSMSPTQIPPCLGAKKYGPSLNPKKGKETKVSNTVSGLRFLQLKFVSRMSHFIFSAILRG